MDKSESESLEDWDLVSSVYDPEQDKNQVEKKTDTQLNQPETSSNDIPDTSSNNVTETNLVGTIDRIVAAVEEIIKCDIDSDVKTHDDILKTDDSAIEIVSKETIKIKTEPHLERENIDEVEEAAIEGDTEEMSEPDTGEEITVIETIMYDVKKISDVDSDKNMAANIEKISSAIFEEGDCEKSQETGDISSKVSDDDNQVKECFDIKPSDKESDVDVQLKVDNDDHVRNIESSVEQSESSSIIPVVYPELTEQENASIESSSSDIDIIDEIMEDSVTSTFLHPLSLSISSSVDTSSILTSPLSDDKNTRIEEIRQTEESESCSLIYECHPKPQEVQKTIPKQSYHEYEQSSKENKNVHQKSKQRPRDSHSNIFGSILHFLRNMKCLEWSLLGSLVISIFLTVICNQTNIFAIVEQGEVVSEMKKMIDELKYDNKLLKDQMLSEMKNDKVFSSVEHQIKELRKENSRLNHMLYDVAKVLEKQKDAHDKYEKKGDDYLVPFKKEINKLKEQINNLKIDNEDLQKQLVRIRYASYSQGGKDASDDKNKKRNEESKTDETNSADEIPIDINSLKKWNELISLLSKELGLSLENGPQSEKSYSESRKNISWYWKVFLRDFKGKFDEFKANITSKISDYKKVHENTMSGVYKFVKNFFKVEEQNNQQFAPPNEENSHWNSFGDFFSDLKDKWSKIKNRIDASDLKSFFKDLKTSGNDKTPQYESQKPRNSPYEHNERKPTNIQSESERKPTNVHFGSDRKHDKMQEDPEDSKWLFERATLRAELRDEKEDDVNWFLKKNKHSEDNSEETKY